MLRDLPKSVPSAVLSAAQGALDDTEDLIGRASLAKAAYQNLKGRHRSDEERVRLGEMRLDARADAIVAWGAMLQKQLPSGALAHRFWISGAAHGPCVLAVSAEIALPYRPGFQGGTLRTELSLVLDRTEGLFRQDDWFDGYRMTGGGLLNSASSLVMVLQPEMLVRLHDDIAEGKNGPQIVAAFDRLVHDRKDR
jgi:hypothetical protein